MPQLDSVTYLSQFVWLCVFFIGFYLLLVTQFLPTMARLFKIRASFAPAGGSTESDTGETEALRAQYDAFYNKTFSRCKQSLAESFSHTSEWSHSVVKTTNATTLLPVHTAYIEASVDAVLHQERVLQDVTALLPLTHLNSTDANLFASRVLKSFK